MLPTVQVAVKGMLSNMAATWGLGCAPLRFHDTAEDIADGLPPGADGKPDLEWVVAALPILIDYARQDGNTFLCEDCVRESGRAVTDETLILDLYGQYF